MRGPRPPPPSLCCGPADPPGPPQPSGRGWGRCGARAAAPFPSLPVPSSASFPPPPPLLPPPPSPHSVPPVVPTASCREIAERGSGLPPAARAPRCAAGPPRAAAPRAGQGRAGLRAASGPARPRRSPSPFLFPAEEPLVHCGSTKGRRPAPPAPPGSSSAGGRGGAAAEEHRWRRAAAPRGTKADYFRRARRAADPCARCGAGAGRAPPSPPLPAAAHCSRRTWGLRARPRLGAGPRGRERPRGARARGLGSAALPFWEPGSASGSARLRRQRAAP